MLRIGKLFLKGRGTRPHSRESFKANIKEWARDDLGLEIRFVIRKITPTWYCDVWKARITVCEGVGNQLYPLSMIMEYTLHEMAHWIQFNEGMFTRYFGQPYYGGIREGTRSKKDVMRLALRAERHADWLATRLLKEMYGMEAVHGSIYDDTRAAREFIAKHYNNLGP